MARVPPNSTRQDRVSDGFWSTNPLSNEDYTKNVPRMTLVMLKQLVSLLSTLNVARVRLTRSRLSAGPASMFCFRVSPERTTRGSILRTRVDGLLMPLEMQ